MSEPQPFPSPRPPLHVQRDPARDRYVATLGDAQRIAALVDYEDTRRGIVLVHTEVQEGFEGQGIGSRLVKAVFDDVRSRGGKVIPQCPFILRWLERHPEQHDLLASPLEPPGALPPAGPTEPA